MGNAFTLKTMQEQVRYLDVLCYKAIALCSEVRMCKISI